MRTLPPQQVVASFDSATVLHAAVAAALHGQPFPHLGHSAAAGVAIRGAGRLPWGLLRGVYTRMGASEGIEPGRLGDVDLEAVAAMLVENLPRRPFPGVMLGSSNGAFAHLAAAMQVPWLPGTVLVPVARRGDPDRPVDAMDFGRRLAGPLLERNPDVVLHHMHDQAQDELMVARMTYFRVKWRALPAAYATFLKERLVPGAPVVVLDDRSRWPVVNVGERHVFQPGAQGGLRPEDYLRRPHTPTPDGDAPEAEWGSEPGFTAAVERWATTHDHPLVKVGYHGPQTPSHPVAAVVRDWYANRGERSDRLVVPSFVLGDPWTTLNRAAVPFWTFFSVQPALESLRLHLARSEPYRRVDVILFQHGVASPGIARPEEWLSAAAETGADAHLLGVDPRRFPHDIASVGRYGPRLADLPRATRPWPVLTPFDAVGALRRHHELDMSGAV